MSSNIISEDLRVRKTEKALYAAMSYLLKNHNFGKITIKGICEEALISRAAFYTHFIDKYDLLKHWLKASWPKEFDGNHTYEQIEQATNHHIDKNTSVLKNLLYEADNETINILFEFILFTSVNLTIEKSIGEELYIKDIVLSNFYAGGIISYISWQIENKFPSDVPLMNRCFYEMLHHLQDWPSK